MFRPELYKDAPAVPRYLFRAWSPASDGENHHSSFKSLAWSNRLSRNSPNLQHLATHHRANAQDIFMNHIKWSSRQYCPEDILISFTSSLLHVLTHATYKIHSTQQIPATTLSDCWITIIDTSKLPAYTFLKTKYLLKKLSITNWGPFSRWRHNQGEFLAEYELDLSQYPGAAFAVLMGYLIHTGNLFSLLPELGEDEFTKLELFMKELRYQRYRQPTVLAPMDIVAARRFAARFPEYLQGYMRIWALAFAARNSADPLLLQEFTDRCFEGLDVYFLFKSENKPIHDILRDVKQFKQLMMLALSLQKTTKSIRCNANKQ